MSRLASPNTRQGRASGHHLVHFSHAGDEAVSISWRTRVLELDEALYTQHHRTHVWDNENETDETADGMVELQNVRQQQRVAGWILTTRGAERDTCHIVSVGQMPRAVDAVLRLVQALQARMRVIRVALASQGADSRRRNEWSARYQAVGFRVRASSFSTAGKVLLEWNKDLDLQEESRLVTKALRQEEADEEEEEKGKQLLPETRMPRSMFPKCTAAFDRKACPLALIRKPPTLQLLHGSPTWAILQQFVIDVKPKVQRFFSVAYQSKQPSNHDLSWVSRHSVTLAMNLFDFTNRLRNGDAVTDKPRLHLNIVLLQCIAEFVKRGYNGDLVDGVSALVNETTAFPKGTHPLLDVAKEFARIGSWEELEALGKFNVCKLALETQQVLFCGAQETALTYAHQETSFLYTYTLSPDQRTSSWFVRLNDPKTLWGMLQDDMPFGLHAEDEQAEKKDANIRYKYDPNRLIFALVCAAGQLVTELRDHYQSLGAIKAMPEDEVGYVLMPILLRLHQLFCFKEPRTLAALARVKRDGLGAHGIERNTFLEGVFDIMEEHRNTSLSDLMGDRFEGIAPALVYNWDKLFDVPLSSRRVVWVGMYPNFFGGSGRHISRVSYYEDDAMLASMFLRSKWYQANKACIIGWFGNSQHEWVVADPQARGVLAKLVPGINIAGPIDNIFRRFDDYEKYHY